MLSSPGDSCIRIRGRIMQSHKLSWASNMEYLPIKWPMGMPFENPLVVGMMIFAKDSLTMYVTGDPTV